MGCGGAQSKDLGVRGGITIPLTTITALTDHGTGRIDHHGTYRNITLGARLARELDRTRHERVVIVGHRASSSAVRH